MSKESQPMVVFDKIGIRFQKHSSLADWFRRRNNRKLDFWALQDISFTVNEGESLGVIGRNGSGKSTLSMVCTKIYQPDKGKIEVNGQVQLLSFGVGFQNQLSGRENVFISGTLLGLTISQVRQRMKEIEEFADIGDFMDEPVRTYSAGMRGRLGFAIATTIRPDILILDEIIATGDTNFQDKAVAKMKNMRELARCAIIVSHSPPLLESLCNRIIWLDKGRLIMDGKPNPVLEAYEDFCKDPQAWKNHHQEYFSRSNPETSPANG